MKKYGLVLALVVLLASCTSSKLQRLSPEGSGQIAKGSRIGLITNQNFDNEPIKHLLYRYAIRNSKVSNNEYKDLLPNVLETDFEFDKEHINTIAKNENLDYILITDISRSDNFTSYLLWQTENSSYYLKSKVWSVKEQKVIKIIETSTNSNYYRGLLFPVGTIIGVISQDMEIYLLTALSGLILDAFTLPYLLDNPDIDECFKLLFENL
jgi:hypothetical protein